MSGGVLLAAGETMAMIVPTRAEPFESAELYRVDAGGAESNVASHVAALGHRARWVSRVGDDAPGRRIVATLRTRGVDVSGIFIDPQHPTGIYLKDPGRGVQYYRDGSAASFLDEEEADAIRLADVDVLHLSGITAALVGPAPRFLRALVARARREGVTVSFDVNHRASLWPAGAAGPVLRDLAAQAHIVFVGRDEAEALWRTTDAASIRALLPDVPELVVKDGEVGAWSFCGSGMEFAPSPAVEVVEIVGAGDAFAGGYLAARLSGESVARRLQAGHARAALTLATTTDFPEAEPGFAHEAAGGARS